jgi:hypothetical protein
MDRLRGGGVFPEEGGEGEGGRVGGGFWGGGGGEWGIKVSDRNCLIAQGLLTCLL